MGEEHATERTLGDEAPALVAAPPSAPLAGRYRLRGILGRGGMGTVYRAEDLELGVMIALKIVTKGTASEAALERQRDEVTLARRVTHTNVARTYDIGEHHGLRFITMELVDGPSLRDVIASDTSIERRLGLIAHVASGLAAIHDAEISHRDLKPENVLVSAAGVAKITDFGIARTAASVASGMTTGTPRYMAPEVLAGAPPTRAADVYAFGLVAYETITAERFRGGDPDAAVRVLRGVLGAGREDVSAFIGSCLEEAPTSRPPSVRPIETLLGREPASAPLEVDISKAARARLGAFVFTADAADAWLSDSIPSEIVHALAKVDGLEVVTMLLRAGGTTAATIELGIDVAISGSVRRDADGQLHLSVRAVSTDDQLQLWARSTSMTMDRLSAHLREIAELVAGAVLDLERTHCTTQEEDPRVTELVLRASHEDHDPWRVFGSQASVFLEEAHALAPDDPVVLASLALTLLGGFGSYDAERFHRARRAAERAVELDSANPDCQLALGATLFMANDPLGAITSLRWVLRGAPSAPGGHGMTAAIAIDVGLLAEGGGRSSLAMALDPGLAPTRITTALGREYAGERAAADALVDGGLASDSPIARLLSAMLGSRLAIWRGSAADVAQLLVRFAPLRGAPFIEPIVAALERTVPLDQVMASLGPVSSMAPEWARQRCVRLQIETELLFHHGELTRAAEKLEELVGAGSYDSSWFAKCPVVERLAASIDISPLRARVEARAETVRRAMAAAGLRAAPRHRR